MADVNVYAFNDLPETLKSMVYLGSKNKQFLSMATQLNGAGTISKLRYEMGQTFANQTGAIPTLTEAQVTTGVDNTKIDRTANENTAMFFQEKFKVSHLRQSQTAGLTGFADKDGSASANPVEVQLEAHLKKMNADMSKSFLYGVKNYYVNETTAVQTGGIITETKAGANGVDNGALAITGDLFTAFIGTMADNGAELSENATIFCGSQAKAWLSKEFGLAERNVEVGGVALDVLKTDFGNLLIRYDSQIASGDILVADMNFVRPVFLPYEQEAIAVEKLAQTGASSMWHAYAQAGIDFFSPNLHGVFYNFTI